MVIKTLNSWGTDAIALVYVLAFIFLATSIAGKQAISWILMKLYEFFILKNPTSV